MPRWQTHLRGLGGLAPASACSFEEHARCGTGQRTRVRVVASPVSAVMGQDRCWPPGRCSSVDPTGAASQDGPWGRRVPEATPAAGGDGFVVPG